MKAFRLLSTILFFGATALVFSQTISSTPTFTIAEGGNSEPIDLKNYINFDGDKEALTFSISENGEYQSSSSVLNGSSFTYYHDGSESTSDEVQFSVINGSSDPVIGILKFTITPVNDPPRFPENIQPIEVDEGGVSNSLIINGYDDESDPIDYAISVYPQYGQISIEDGVLIYYHDGSEIDSDTFTLKVFETGKELTSFSTQKYDINVTASNDAPTASLIEDTLVEGGAKTFTFGPDTDLISASLTFSDPDTDPNQLTLRISQSPVNGSATVSGKSIVYEHDGSETTVDSFVYEIFDGSLSTSYTAQLLITVSNDSPIANDDTYFIGSTEESISIDANVGVLQNDSDSEGQALSAVVSDEPSNGLVVLNPDGSFTYTPNNVVSIADSFTYIISDGVNESEAATVTIESNAIRPIPDFYNLEEGGTLIVEPANGLLSNDIDSNNLSISAEIVTQPNYGVISIAEDGSFEYTHDGSDNLNDQFSYKAVNSNGDESRPVFVILAASNINDAPVSFNTSITVSEGGSFTFTPNYEDSDTDFSSISFNVSSNDLGTDSGILELNEEGTLTYRHNGSEVFSDLFTFSVSDDEFVSNSSTIRVTVLPENDAPNVSSEGVVLEVNEGQSVTEEISVSDSEEDNIILFLDRSNEPSNGSLSISGSSITYTHNGSENFTDTFSLIPFDGASYGSPQSFSVNITELNDPPILKDTSISFSVPENGSEDIPIGSLFIDEEGDTILIEISEPANGEITIDGNTYTYKHNGSETSTDSFIVTAFNEGENADRVSQKISLNITAVNDLPIINGLEGLTIDQLDELTIIPIIKSSPSNEIAEGTFEVIDPDDAEEDIELTISNASGKFSYVENSDGSFTLFDENTSDDNFNDTYTFTVTATDSSGESTSKVVNVSVIDIVETLPQVVLRSDNLSVEEGGDLVIKASLISNNFYSKRRNLPDSFTDNFEYLGKINGHVYWRYIGGMSEYDPNNYFRNLTYSEAANIATQVGGYPLVLETESEYDAFKLLVADTDYKVWVGYVSDGSNFSWLNSANTAYETFPWATGFPVDVNDNRATSFNTGDGTFINSSITRRTGNNNYNDSSGSGLIVEFDQLVVIGDTPVTFTVDVTGSADISGDNYDFEGIATEATIEIPAFTDDEYSITLKTRNDSLDEETETVIITARSDSNDNFLVRRSKGSIEFDVLDNDDTSVTYALISDKQNVITTTEEGFEVNESAGELSLNVTLTNEKTYDTFLEFDISSDNAEANEDYSSPNVGYVDNFLNVGDGIRGLAVLESNIYYISNNRRIAIFDTESEITTYLNENQSNGEIANSYDAVESFDVVQFRSLKDMTSDSNGNIFIIDDYYIRKLNTSTREVSFIAGNTRGNNPIDEDGSSARFVNPAQIAVNSDGTILYVYDTRQIRRVDIDSNGIGTVTTVAGTFNNYGRTDGDGQTARIGNILDMEVAANGDLYFADDQYIRKLSNGEVSTVKWINEQISGIDLSGNNLYISTRWSNQLLKLNLSNDQLLTLVDSRNNSTRDRLNGPLDESKISDVLDVQLLDDRTLLFVEQTNTGQHIRKLDFINKIRIKAGETSASYTLNILDDNVYELPETILVTPSVGDGIVVDDTAINISILSDDPEPEVQVTSSTSLVDESAEAIVFTVQLGNALEASAKSDLDAVAASQYTFIGEFEGSKYYQSNFNRNWSEAKIEAEQLGGSLVVINSANENEFIRTNRPNSSSVWIGYSDDEREGSFVWANGSSSNYTNWQNGQPDNAGDEDFAEFQNNGRWNDLPQWINLPYIIEFSGVKSSLPTTVTLTVDDINGAATSGTDFTVPEESLTLTIPAGENKSSVSFELNDDSDPEAAEFIQVSISEVVGGIKSVENGLARVEILDNDPNVITVDASALEFSENGDSINVSATSQIAKQSETTVVVKFNQGGSDTAEENKDFFVPELDQISTIAGSGQRGYVEGKGGEVRFRSASKMAELAGVGFLVADQENNVVRLINSNGEVSTYIGNGNGWSNQNQNGMNRLEVSINGPSDIAISPSGEIFIAEAWQNRISKIDANGNYQIIANSSGDGGSENNENALLATFQNPRAIEFDSQGALYVVENNRIRKITFENGNASVSDYAGTGQNGNQNGDRLEATFQGPQDIIIDENDIMYVAEHNRIRKITPQGVVSTFAGQWWGDNDGSFQTAQFRNPSALAFDSNGNILVTDDDQSSLRILYLSGDKQGQVETLIGKKGSGFVDGDFSDAKLNRPRGLIANASKILIADTDNNRIRQITLEPTIIIPAGETSGSITISPIDDYKFESAESLSLSVVSTSNVNESLSSLSSLAINLLSDDDAPFVRLMSSTNAISEGGGQAELSVRLSDQYSTSKPDMDDDKKGNYYYLGEFNGSHYYSSKQDGWVSYSDAKRIAENLGGSLAIISSQQENDFITDKIFEKDPSWDPNDNRWLNHWIGYAYDQEESGEWKWSNNQVFNYTNWQGDNYLRNAENRPYARLHENGRWDIASNNDSQRYVIEFSGATSDVATSVAISITGTESLNETDYTSTVSESITIPAGEYKSTFAITGLEDEGEDEPIEFLTVAIAAIEGSGVSVDENNSSVTIQINDNDLTTATIASSAAESISEVDGQFEITAELTNAKPYPVVIDLSFDSETEGSAIFGEDYTSSSLNKTSTIAGSGTYGFLDGNALDAQFQSDIRGLVADKDGNLYVADANRSLIRKYDVSTNTVSTYVGNPNGGGNSEEGDRSEIRLGFVRAIASDKENNRLYFYDDWTRLIRSVDLTTGQVSFVAGNNSGNGNDGSATEASFQGISAMTVDSSGDIYMIDNTQLRKIDITEGLEATVTTLAGAYNNGGNQDGFGDEVRISWSDLKGMDVDPNGDIIFADSGQHRIRKYNIETGEVTTIAGQWWDYADGVGSNARFKNPIGLAITSNGDIYVSDAEDKRIRKIVQQENGTYIVSTVAGSGKNGYKDGEASSTEFGNPLHLTVFGDQLALFDQGNSVIRQIQLTPTITIPAGQTTGTFSIEAINDVVYETDEQILATASVVSGATLTEGSTNFSATLTSDDNIPIVALAADQTIVKENGGKIQVELTLLDEEGSEVIWSKNDLAEDTKASFNFLGEFEGHKYYQSFNEVSFTEALSTAQSLGGQLLVVDSQLENDFIGRTIRNGSWLGISDEETEGTWLPLYGDSTYQNFDANNNEPNGGTGENFAVTWGNQWYDVNSNNRHSFIIEFGPTKASGLDTVVTLAVSGTATSEAQGEDVADYSLSTQEITIPAGENSAILEISTGDDKIDEPIETVELSISSIATFNDLPVATISQTKSSLVVEIDDDEAPEVILSVSANNLAENKGSTTLTATLSNEKVSDTEILFDFGGEATFLDDYRSSDLGKVETIAGVLKGSGFVNGSSEIARFSSIWGMAPYKDGSYLVSDNNNNTIRKINADGSVENFIGNGNGCCQDTGLRSSVSINRPTYLSVDDNYNVYFASQSNRIYKYDDSTDRVSVIAGDDWGFADGTGQAARFRNPYDVETNSDGSLIYVLDESNRTIRRLSLNDDGAYEVTSLLPMNNQNQTLVTGPLDEAQIGSAYEIEVDWEENLIYVLSNIDWGRTALSIVDLNQNVLRSTIITNNQGYYRYWGFDLDETDKSLYLTDTQERSIVKMNYGLPENSRYLDTETGWLFQSYNDDDLFKFYQLADDPNTIEAVVEYNFTGGSVIWEGGYQTGTSYGVQSNNTVLADTYNYFRQFEPGVYKIQVNTTNLTYSVTQTSDIPTRGYSITKVVGGERGYADGSADEARFEIPSAILLDGSSAIVYDDQNELVRKVRIKPALIVEGRSKTASIDLTAHKDQYFEGEEVIDLSVAQITNGFTGTTSFDPITITDATFLTRVTNAPFEGVQDGKVSWGDYDRDGDMDLLLMGSGTDGTITNIYRNIDGEFVNTNQNFTKYLGGDAEFVDVDQDGWLDVALSGNSPQGRISELYINRGADSPTAPFFQLSTNYVVEGLSQSDMEWGDLDNDGDPDLIISGINDDNQYRSIYYTNLGNYTFLEEELFNRQGRIQAEIDMFDSDNDGDLDVGIAGVGEGDNFGYEFITNSYYGATQNYDANYNFNNYQWLREGKTMFLDLDVDSRMDYFAMGLDDNRNTQQRSNLGVSLNPLSNPDFAFADYNNDGLNDVVITGEDEQGNPVTKLYVTLGGVEFGYRLYETDIELVALRESTVDWIDYDLDGDLDLFMTGIDDTGVPISVLYEANNVANLNEAPAKVTNVTAVHTGNGLVQFDWDKPTDNANSEFRYALRVGTSSGASDVLYVNATETGTRLIDEPALSTLNSRELILNPGTYYAAVQAIDAGNRGGAFSDEIQFTVDYTWKRLNLGGIIDRSLRPESGSQIEFVDYDGDGDMDLIGSNVRTDYTYGGAINIFGFENEVFVPKQQVGGGSTTFGLGDLNKNGFVDMVYAQEGQDGSRIHPMFNMQPIIQEGIANGEDVSFMDPFFNGYNFQNDNLIPSLYDAKVAIKDLDNDGMPEVILAGASSQIESEATAAVYLLRMNLNEGETELQFDNFYFTYEKLIENNAKLEGLSFLSFDLGDVDGDSDYDLLFTGFGFDGYETILFENTGDLDGDLFVETDNNFIAVREGSASFVDVDGDGLLDVVFTGQSGEGDAFRVYKNTGNIQNFAALEVGLPAIRKSNIDFGDFNEDGYYDILYSGTIQGEGRTTRLAEFNPSTGQFEDSDFDVSSYLDANVGFGDFDGDGDLDFVLSGEDANNDSGQIQQIADIFINVRDLATAQNSRISLAKEGNNSGLGAPTISTARRRRIAENSYEVTVEWGGAKNKNGNPDSALTYELKVGTSKNGTEVLSTVANADGVRAVATTGNAESNTSWKLNLPEGTYFAQVQAVDASYQGSEFSEIFEFAVVNSFKLGDANGDDVVNVLDLTTNIEYIMTGVEPTAFVPEVADVNLDGAINVTDISGIVEIILNPETATSRIALSKAVDKSDYFSNKVVGEAELALQNGAVKLRSDREVVALQFSVNKDAAIRLNDRLSSNFNVVNFERDNRIHYLVYSLNNQNILGVTDQLFTVSGNTKLDVSDLAANTAGVGTLSIEFLDESYLDQYNNGAVFYPNPAREVASLYVGLEDATRVQVELFNMQGTPVLQYATEKNVDQINLNVSNLSSGLYAARIQITTEDGRTVTRSLKLVIQ